MRENYDTGQFEEDYKAASAIASQNDRYETALSDSAFEGEDLKEFQQIALSGIHTEQRDLVDDLSQRNYDIYKELALADIKTEQSILGAQTQLGQETDHDSALSERIYKAAKRAIELSPQSQEEASELVTSKVEQLPPNPKKSELASYIVQQELLREQIAGIYEIAGRPWPVPTASQPIENEPKPTTQTIDIIPDSPPQGAEHDILVGLTREMYGRNESASELLSMCLQENVNKSLTALDIGRMIYSAEELSKIAESGKNLESYIRGRVHRLLTPSDSRVPGLLVNENYSLQYGFRMTVDQSGKQIGHTQRIYRAVQDIEGLTLPKSYVETVNEIGGMIPAESERHSIANEQSGLSEQEGRMVVIESIIDSLSELSLVKKDSNKLNARYLKIRLMQLSKMDPRRFGKHGEFENLKNTITTEPLGNHIETRFVVAACIGDKFGSNLSDKEGQSVMRQVDAAVANFMIEGESEAA